MNLLLIYNFLIFSPVKVEFLIVELTLISFELLIRKNNLK